MTSEEFGPITDQEVYEAICRGEVSRVAMALERLGFTCDSDSGTRTRVSGPRACRRADLEGSRNTAASLIDELQDASRLIKGAPALRLSRQSLAMNGVVAEFSNVVCLLPRHSIEHSPVLGQFQGVLELVFGGERVQFATKALSSQPIFGGADNRRPAQEKARQENGHR